MPSFIPSTERIPGVYQRVLLEKEGASAPGVPKVLYIAWRRTSASSANDNLAVRVRSRQEATAINGVAGAGDLMVKRGFAEGKLARFDSVRGITPQIYLMNVPPVDGADVAAVFTVTFSGTATTAGLATLRVGDQSVSTPVAVGDTAANIAAALEAELANVETELPFTAGVAGAVITFTAREKGSFGNELVLEYVTGFGTPAGVTAAVAQTVVGTGAVDLTTALDAALAQGPWSDIAISEDSSAARTALAAHVVESWDYTKDVDHIGICAVGGDLSDAQTAAAAVDDWRVALGCAEKVTGAEPPPFDAPNSARSFSFEVAASLAARLFSQEKPNHNFNNHRLTVSGRPRTVDRDTVNDSINAGVTVVLAHKNGTDPGQIIDFVSTATTDQTEIQSGAPDRTWAPIEVAKVVQAMKAAVRAELAGFEQLLATEQTRVSAKNSVLRIMEQFHRNEQIAKPDQDDVVASFEIVGGATHLVIEQSYDVTVGIDIVGVTHKVGRAAAAA